MLIRIRNFYLDYIRNFDNSVIKKSEDAVKNGQKTGSVTYFARHIGMVNKMLDICYFRDSN